MPETAPQSPARNPGGRPVARKQGRTAVRPAVAQTEKQPLALQAPALPLGPLALPDLSTLPRHLLMEDYLEVHACCMDLISHPDFPVLPLQEGMDALDYLRAGIRHALKARIPASRHPGVVFEFTCSSPRRVGYHITSDECDWVTVAHLTEHLSHLDPRTVPSLIRHLQQNSYFCGPLYTPINSAEYLEMREDWMEMDERAAEVRQRLADERDVDPETIEEEEIQRVVESEFFTAEKVKKQHPHWFSDLLTLPELRTLLGEHPPLLETVDLLERLEQLSRFLMESSQHGDIELPTLEDWHCHSYVFCISPTTTIDHSNPIYEMFEEEMQAWGEGLCPYFIGELGEEGLGHTIQVLEALEEARQVQEQILARLTRKTEWEE